MPPRFVQLLFTTTFLTLLTLPGLFHLARATRASDLARWQSFLLTQNPAEAMKSIDNDFDKRFLLRFVASAYTASYPQIKSRFTPAIQIGNHGFLFAEEDTQICTAAGFLHPSFPRPRQALEQIIAFDRYLKSKNIHLCLVPVPAKATLYPDRLTADYDLAQGPFLNVDHQRWFELLRKNGVDALDLTPSLWPHRNDTPLLFYPADTHWTDHGKHLAAQIIADHLAPLLKNLPPATPYHTRTTTQTIHGNLVESDNPSPPPPYRDQVIQLYYDETTTQSSVLIPLPSPQVLLLGDSQAANGFDSGNGLQQHLIQSLHTDVASLALAGAGPNEMREQLLLHPDALANKRIVLWVFSIRHLLIKPWDPVELP